MFKEYSTLSYYCDIFFRPLLPRGVLPPPLKKPRTAEIAIPAGLKVPPGMAMIPAGLKRTLVPLGGTANLLAKHSMLMAAKPRIKRGMLGKIIR